MSCVVRSNAMFPFIEIQLFYKLIKLYRPTLADEMNLMIFNETKVLVIQKLQLYNLYIKL